MKHRRAKKKPMNKKLWGFLLIALFLAIGFLYYYTPKEGMREERGVSSRHPQRLEEKGIKRVNLYFSSKDGERLIPESREIMNEPDSVSRAKKAIMDLINGPLEQGLRTIPQDTKLRELYIDKYGQAYIDFSKEIAQNHPGGVWEEMLTVYSVVNTLVFNFSEIKSVKFLIEGKEAETLAGHIDIERPFKENISIIQFN